MLDVVEFKEQLEKPDMENALGGALLSACTSLNKLVRITTDWAPKMVREMPSKLRF